MNDNYYVNMRLVNSDGRVDSSWHESDPELRRSLKYLRDYQELEPESGWRLQTRGTIATWHDFDFGRVRQYHV